MTEIDGGVTAPYGYQAAGVSAVIKQGRTRKDCALIVSDSPASVAGVFTTNTVKAAPVHWCDDICKAGIARAIFVNSGNANACTGKQGMKDCRATAARVAKSIGVTETEVLVCSTGVIGVPLPMDRIADGVAGCLGSLAEDGNDYAARAIMTTDTVPKSRAVEVELSNGLVRIGAIGKGAGMLAPNMATMLVFITTDATIDPRTLKKLLKAAVAPSFNRICVDNDMSTNDTVLILANGDSNQHAIGPDTEDYVAFGEALTWLCVEMAKDLVRDGEGATKLVEIHVEGARNDEDARKAANAIAVSQLCKTAFHGQDPNWGRISCAAGYSGASFDPNDLSVWIGGVHVMKDGGAAMFDEADAVAVMKQSEFTVRVSLGAGAGRAVYWTSDLSKEYVTINADYRS